MDFFTEVGKMAIGSRLRRLSERITEDASHIYQLYNVDLQPKWFPVFYVLSKGQEKTIIAIAEEIGHSHPSVSKIAGEMVKKGLLVEKADKTDGRRNVVSLSRKGMTLASTIQDQYKDVNDVIGQTLMQTRNDLWKAIEEWEFLLDQKSLLRRVQEQKKSRESAAVTIVDYEPKYRKAFKELNEEWIRQYFKMEEADHKSLDNPKKSILDKGGTIFVAIYNGEPVGVCAMIKMNDLEYDFELAKMAVSPKAQGKGVGWILGQAVIKKAKSLGAKCIYLESNTILKPAINLYQKLGFHKVTGHISPYERSNIQMALQLK